MTVQVRKLVLIGVVVVLIPLTACKVFPDNIHWPDGRPVHPRMIPPPPPDNAFAQGTCLIGLNDFAEATVQTWVEDPWGLDIETWNQWFWSDWPQLQPTLQDCITSWVQNQNLLQFWYSCSPNNANPHQYFLPHNEVYIRAFVMNFLCDAYGYAFWPCSPDCGVGPAMATTTDPNSDPPDLGNYAVDPTNPNPPEPIQCATNWTKELCDYYKGIGPPPS